MIRSLLLITFIGSLWSCAPVSSVKLTKKMQAIEQELQEHAGLVIKDVSRDKVIFDYHGDRYFTPASNTKIFTFFASLKILGDSIPAFHYRETNDSLIVFGSGDPSFLYKNVFDSRRAYNFLAAAKKPLYLATSNFFTSSLGNGWAWDDYNSAYSAERSPFPIYGNFATVTLSRSFPVISPKYFQSTISVGEPKERTQVLRQFEDNRFTFHWGKRRSALTEWEVSFKTDRQIITELLADTLHRAVVPLTGIRRDSTKQWKTLYSIPSDSLYSVMMQESDNFIAEQLLLMCADVLSDSLQPEIAIRYVKKNFLQDLPDEPIWVDGSGLSRYNLFTPRSIVSLWAKIYELVPQQRLLPLLATGGVNGTVKNWYRGPNGPYFFGKTGTLSNVHSLSGYLITKSGKTLIFSFMNNNYVQSTTKVRTHMQEILQSLYEKY